jgi:hypothetical protein
MFILRLLFSVSNFYLVRILFLVLITLSPDSHGAGVASCYDAPFSYTGTITSNNRNCVWNGGDLLLNAGLTITNRGNSSNSFTVNASQDGVFSNLGLITYGSNNSNAKSAIFVAFSSLGLNGINNAGVIDGGPTYTPGSASITIESGATFGGLTSSYTTYSGPYYSDSVSSAIYNQAGAYIGQNASGGNLSDYGIANTGTINGGTASGNSGAIFNAGTIAGVSAAILNNNGGIINNAISGNFYSAIANLDGGVLSGGILNGGDIGSNAPTSTTYAITNYGSITAPTASSLSNTGWAIYNQGNIGDSSSPGITESIQNAGSGTIAGIYNDAGAYMGSISNSASISSSITNLGRINGISNSFGSSYGTIDSIINKSGGFITGQTGLSSYDYAINNFQAKITTGIDNQSGANIVGGISVTGYGSSVAAITNAGTICAVTGANTCTGAISGSAINVGPAVSGSTPTISAITNTGTISGGTSGANAAGISNAGSITTLTNTGSVSGTYGIRNSGTIGTLNNLQSGLTYTGALPTNYSIIINSASSFGKLSVTSGTGSTAFGIYAGSVASNNYAYTSVLSGLSASQVTNKSGVYLGSGWNLVLQLGSLDTWDLCFGVCSVAPTGPSAVNTQQSLVNTAQALQGTVTILNTTLTNSFSYDCTEFGENGICISVGGRNTAVSAANGLNNTSGLLIAAYRPHASYRIGAYADQNLSVNNAGSTVNLGNNTPLIGLFGAWNQNPDGTGTEVKVSAAYGQKNTTVTRSVVGVGSSASEAGSGGSQINSQGAQVVAKYGFGVTENVIVSPYAGIRYTQNNMGGYTESASSSVTAPLAYSALNTNATTALAGLGMSYKFVPQASVFASAGVETDTNTSNGTYSATGVTGLTPVNFNANPVKTRPTAMLGAYYDVEKNQRLGITGIYRQEPYQAVQTTTVMATYAIGL